ncbi:MAG TPA: cbb3-type cytochrome c oxidase subunit I [Actinomycetota bacterium]|nr:cbb3-type cytochrome c oxidase subunit I [Actinomycetota bacterium]
MLSGSSDRAARSFLFPSIVWLLLGSTALLFAEAKLVSPGLLDVKAFTYPRLAAIASVSFQFGWLTLAGLAAIYYVLPRITGAPMRGETAGVAAGIIINICVLLGITLIMFGGSQGLQWAELPTYLIAPIVFALLLVASAVFRTIGARTEGDLYVSARFFGGAAIWGPLGLAAGHLNPFRDVPDSVAHLFSVNSTLLLWFSAIGVGALLYVVPRAAGSPLYSNRLANIGFWMFAIAAPLAGASRQIFGPSPAWLQTISVAASIALLAPVVAVVVNTFATVGDGWRKLDDNPSLRFFIAGTVVWALGVGVGVLQSMRSVARAVGLSEVSTMQIWLIIFGVSLWFMGLIVFCLPRLLGKRWVGSDRLTAHLWTTLTGIAVLVGSGLASALATQSAIHGGAVAGTPISFGDGFLGASSGDRMLRLSGLAGALLIVVGQWIFLRNTMRATTSGEPRPVEVVLGDEAVA